MHFNILDMTVYAILIVSVAAGFYQGFLATSANTAGCFLSLLAAWLFHGGAAASVKAQGKVIDALLYYSETSDMLGSVDVYRTGVEGMTKEKLDAILQNVSLPHPVDQWFSHNVLNRAYSSEGIGTLGGYLSHTVAEVAVNIGCFLMIFLGVYIAVTLIVNLVHYVAKLPATRRFDGALGGAAGLVRGVLLAYALFLVVPAVLAMLPVQQVKEIVDTSAMAGIFYKGNFLFGMIGGHIG